MLTVDLGNSRLKAVRWARAASGHEPRARFEGEDLGAFELWLAGERDDLGALASVASAERTERVRAALASACARAWIAPPSGLVNRCRPPSGVGADRLYAAAGAAASLGRSCVVVDAGTALTVDVVRVAAAREFLGGAIAPGPRLLALALATGTARLPLAAAEPGAPALGQDTESAIRAGVCHGFRGAAHRLVEELVRAAELAAPTVVVTGGARELLLRPTAFTERPLEVVPDLVHRGLLAALLAVAEAP